MSTQVYHLPDLLSLLGRDPGSVPNGPNPHLKEAEASFKAWVQSQSTIAADYQKIMEECDAPLFTASLWPYSTHEWLMGLIAFNAAAFLLDDLIERSSKEDAPLLVYLWLKSLRDTDPIQHPLMAIVQTELQPLVRRALGPFHWLQFVTDNETWVVAMGKESRDREAYAKRNELGDIQWHLEKRRATTGAYVCLTMIRSSRCLDIPDDILAHPVVTEMANAAMDLMAITNDIYSFWKEQKFDKAFGNILRVILKDKETAHLDLQGAVDYATKMIEENLQRFYACKLNLPSFNPEVDAYLATYAEAMIDTAAGNVYWHIHSPRYNVFENEEDRKSNIVRWAM